VVDPLAAVVIAASLAMTGWSLVLVALARGPQVSLLVGLGVLEVLLLVQAVVAVVQLAGGDRPAETGVFVAYLAISVLAVPAGALWALTDRSRYGPAVLAVACLVGAVLVLRLQQLWGGPGA
jgi:hypothetical protein